MSKYNLNKILKDTNDSNTPVDISNIENDMERYSAEFEKCNDSLSIDIDHIDSRLTLIQGYITNIDTQLSNLKNLIKNTQHPNEKGKYYNLLNQSLELGIKYHELYLKALDIKHKYRKEQDEFVYKKADFFGIKVKRAELDTSKEGLSLSALMDLIKNVETKMVSDKSKSKPKTESDSEQKEVSNPVFDAISLLNEDPDYRL